MLYFYIYIKTTSILDLETQVTHHKKNKVTHLY